MSMVEVAPPAYMSALPSAGNAGSIGDVSRVSRYGSVVTLTARVYNCVVKQNTETIILRVPDWARPKSTVYGPCGATLGTRVKYVAVTTGGDLVVSTEADTTSSQQFLVDLSWTVG